MSNDTKEILAQLGMMAVAVLAGATMVIGYVKDDDTGLIIGFILSNTCLLLDMKHKLWLKER